MNVGVTEPCWSSLSEDRRVSWKYLSRSIAVVGAFFVTRTGNLYFDLTLATLVAAFLLIVIETQRSYSKLSPKFRKRSVRVAVFLGSWGLGILGIAVFAEIALASSSLVFVQRVSPILQLSPSDTRTVLWKAIWLSAFFVAVPIALMRVFRQLQIVDLVYHLPRSGLVQLLVHKKYKATSFAQFAYFELSALVFCLIYADSVGYIASTAINFVYLFHEVG